MTPYKSIFVVKYLAFRITTLLFYSIYLWRNDILAPSWFSSVATASARALQRNRTKRMCVCIIVIGSHGYEVEKLYDLPFSKWRITLEWEGRGVGVGNWWCKSSWDSEKLRTEALLPPDQKTEEGCLTLPLPFILFGLSVNWILPTGFGEAHLLYSAHQFKC